MNIPGIQLQVPTHIETNGFVFFFFFGREY
jgi:hypothetical protein